jgi:hypothetical protein
MPSNISFAFSSPVHFTKTTALSVTWVSGSKITNSSSLIFHSTTSENILSKKNFLVPQKNSDGQISPVPDDQETVSTAPSQRTTKLWKVNLNVAWFGHGTVLVPEYSKVKSGNSRIFPGLYRVFLPYFSIETRGKWIMFGIVPWKSADFQRKLFRFLDFFEKLCICRHGQASRYHARQNMEYVSGRPVFPGIESIVNAPSEK